MRALQKSLTLRIELVRAEPGNAGTQAGLGMAINNLGALLSGTNRKLDALPLFRRAEARLRFALDREPNNFNYGRMTLQSINNVLLMERELGPDATTRQTNRHGLELSRTLAAANPQVPQYALNRFQFARQLGDGLAVAKKRKDAIAAYREAIEVSRGPLLQGSSNLWADVAATAAQCAELIDEESSKDAAESRGEKEGLIELAMDQLRRSVTAGLITNRDYLPNNPALRILRDREDFRDLQAKVRKVDKVAVVAVDEARATATATVPKQATAAQASFDDANWMQGDLGQPSLARGDAPPVRRIGRGQTALRGFAERP